MQARHAQQGVQLRLRFLPHGLGIAGDVILFRQRHALKHVVPRLAPAHGIGFVHGLGPQGLRLRNVHVILRTDPKTHINHNGNRHHQQRDENGNERHGRDGQGDIRFAAGQEIRQELAEARPGLFGHATPGLDPADRGARRLAIPLRAAQGNFLGRTARRGGGSVHCLEFGFCLFVRFGDGFQFGFVGFGARDGGRELPRHGGRGQLLHL